MRSAWFALLATAMASMASAESVCRGTVSRGRLEGGVKLPGSGANFRAYSSLGSHSW